MELGFARPATRALEMKVVEKIVDRQSGSIARYIHRELRVILSYKNCQNRGTDEDLLRFWTADKQDRDLTKIVETAEQGPIYRGSRIAILGFVNLTKIAKSAEQASIYGDSTFPITGCSDLAKKLSKPWNKPINMVRFQKVR